MLNSPSNRRSLFPLIALSIVLVILSAALSGCSAQNSTSGHSFTMASLAEMPEEVQQAPVTVQEAYQFAFANPAVLQELPCYCGCGSMGHTSNYDCYVAGQDAEGLITYDPHALGCSICVDITRDAMRLLDQGKEIKEIRAYVDDTYARYGPSNMP
jgi:hypothetical protein